MSDPQARRFWDVARAQMRQIASDLIGERRTQSEGGPYGRVWVNKSGFVIKAEAGGGGIDSAAQLANGTTQSMTANSAATYTSWVSGNVVYDSDSYWSSGNAARLTAPADGKYLITAAAQISPSAGVYDVRFEVRHNNTALYGTNYLFWHNARVDAAAGTLLAATVVGELQLNAGQYVYLVCDSDYISGSTGNLLMDPYLFTMRRMA